MGWTQHGKWRPWSANIIQLYWFAIVIVAESNSGSTQGTANSSPRTVQGLTSVGFVSGPMN